SACALPGIFGTSFSLLCRRGNERRPSGMENPRPTCGWAGDFGEETGTRFATAYERSSKGLRIMLDGESSATTCPQNNNQQNEEHEDECGSLHTSVRFAAAFISCASNRITHRESPPVD